MIHGYIFPAGMEVDAAHRHEALPVDVHSPLPILEQAAQEERLRCPYSGCLAPLALFHREGRLYFRHLPNTSAPLCPYFRSGGAGGGSSRVVQSGLEFQLQRWLHGLPEVRIAAITGAGGVRLDGWSEDGRAVYLVPLTRRTVDLHLETGASPPHVLYFMTADELPSLEPRRVNATSLSARPAIVVDAEDNDRFLLVDALPAAGWPAEAAPLADLTLVYVAPRELLGLEREPEVLFVLRPAGEAIAWLRGLLEAGLPAAVGKVVRRMLGRLFLEGAGVERVWRLSAGVPAGAPLPWQLPAWTDEELFQIADPRAGAPFAGHPQLAALYQEVVREALVEGWVAPRRNLEESRRRLERELDTARRELAASRERAERQGSESRRLEEERKAGEQRARRVEQELQAARQQLARRSAEIGGMERELSSTRGHLAALERSWPVRLGRWLGAIRP